MDLSAAGAGLRAAGLDPGYVEALVRATVARTWPAGST